MKLKWEGREAVEHTKPVNELLEWIPIFKRSPLSLVDGDTNKYLDMIIRQSLSSDAEYIKDRLDIIVCTATKRYHLFQHQDVFKALVDALKLIVSDLQSLEATLRIKEYGESMWISFTLANYQLNEADRYPFILEVSGLNTIGAGKALDIRLSWYEPTYKIRIPYGMLSEHKVNFKKEHRKKEKEFDSDTFSDEIYSFLIKHFAQLSRERQLYNRWIAAEVSQKTLARWIDTVVEKKWKYEKAAIAYAIAIDGYDIKVKKSVSEDKDQEQGSEKKIPVPSKLTSDPSQLRYYVRKNKAPEKFAPARNVFDVSLILSWIISQQSTIPDQLKWIDIPILMEALVAEDKRLRFSLHVQPSLFNLIFLKIVRNPPTIKAKRV